MKKIILLISILFVFNSNAQDCSELFISEYVEGSYQNKAIEIYNPTNATIDLSDYQLERYSNGSTSSAAGGITQLSGMLASGDVWIITNGDTDTAGSFGYIDMTLYNMGDQAEPNGSYPTPLHMNGNDAIILTKNGATIDAFGTVGQDPGDPGGWTDDASAGFTIANGAEPWTKDHTLIRKSSVLKGDDDYLDLFNPSVEWDSLPNQTWSKLGSHACDCIASSSINNVEDSYSIYPNPAKQGDNIIIDTKNKMIFIEIYNILGEKIVSQKRSSIPTVNLLKGDYILRIYFKNGHVSSNQLMIN